MHRKIAYYNNFILRKKSEPVEKITEEIRALVQDLIDTVVVEDGAGLAAPQIFESVRIFVTNLYEDEKRGPSRPAKPRVFINPKLSSPSQELEIYEEGCLSFPNIHAPVERPDRITVEAMDLEGNMFTETFHGWEARAVMHENDHLNGVLFVDRVQGKARKEIEAPLRKLKKNPPKQ